MLFFPIKKSFRVKKTIRVLEKMFIYKKENIKCTIYTYRKIIIIIFLDFEFVPWGRIFDIELFL